MGAQITMLLHMHQPDYRHPHTGQPVMPWVRLHASRGYTDVPAVLERTGAGATVNVVPSLLAQLAHYAAGGGDRWLALSQIPAESLTAAQIAFIRAQFFHGHPAMRRVSPRYTALELAVQAGEVLDAQALRDVQVWSNLSWMGSVGRAQPEVAALIAQDRDFTHRQLLGLLEQQRQLVAAVLPRWRRLASVSCTPAYHPILPLLIDFRHAHRCLDIPDEIRFAWPDDARRQLQQARQEVQAVLGRVPAGLWPSEGAVSPETAALAGEVGFSWLATDQAILERSVRDGPPVRSQPWQLAGGIRALFRDRELSDRISFDYQHWQGQEAVEDLLGRIDARYASGVVPLILDGENAWEAFPDAGAAFLDTLMGSGRLVSMDEAATRPPAGCIQRLHTGSWINGDLAVWAGDAEDRRAWALLCQARQAWEDAGRPEAAWPHLAAAEGSDWFWWFGPEHHSEVHEMFDALFRTHLAAVWEALGHAPPAALSRSVSGPA